MHVARCAFKSLSDVIIDEYKINKKIHNKSVVETVQNLRKLAFLEFVELIEL